MGGAIDEGTGRLKERFSSPEEEEALAMETLGTAGVAGMGPEVSYSSPALRQRAFFSCLCIGFGVDGLECRAILLHGGEYTVALETHTKVQPHFAGTPRGSLWVKHGSSRVDMSVALFFDAIGSLCVIGKWVSFRNPLPPSADIYCVLVLRLLFLLSAPCQAFVDSMVFSRTLLHCQKKLPDGQPPDTGLLLEWARQFQVCIDVGGISTVS